MFELCKTSTCLSSIVNGWCSDTNSCAQMARCSARIPRVPNHYRVLVTARCFRTVPGMYRTCCVAFPNERQSRVPPRVRPLAGRAVRIAVCIDLPEPTAAALHGAAAGQPTGHSWLTVLPIHRRPAPAVTRRGRHGEPSRGAVTGGRHRGPCHTESSKETVTYRGCRKGPSLIEGRHREPCHT